MTKRRCCSAPDHELVAVLKGQGSVELERQLEACEPCLLRMEQLGPVTLLLREAVNEELGSVESLWAQSRIQAKLDEPQAQSLLERLSNWWNHQLGERRRLAFALGGAMMLGAVLAPSLAGFFANDSEEMPGRATKDGFQSASVIVESVEVEEDARTVVYQPDDGDTAIIWIDNSPDPDRDIVEAGAR